ncbi:hypothetical protein RB595_006259 [Gaeumannomyces hyphopodioides]
MPPRPVVKFSYPIFVGTDVCRIARVRKILEAAEKREPFVRRVLDREERARIDPILGRLAEEERRKEDEGDGTAGARGPGPAGSWRGAVVGLLSRLARRPPPAASSPERVRLLDQAAVHMAGRFAAKEAIIKAHPHLPKLSFGQIRIHTGPDGAPAAVVTADGREPQQARLSISHDGDYATAVCLGFEHILDEEGGG